MASVLQRLTVVLLASTLAGCATPPLAPAPGPEVTPRAAVTEGLPASEQVWGGVIVGTENLPDYTRLQVISYPLRNQEPQTGRMTDGRFLLEVPGFLDPMDFRSGRLVTARGSVVRTEAGRIGEAEYVFPVMDSSEVHLWPDVPVGQRDTGRVRFGIGVGVRL